MGERSSGRRSRRPLAIGAGVIVLSLAGFALARSATAEPRAADRYRTATVATGSIDQTLALTGTAHLVSQLTATFPVTGRVTSVAVAVGDQVRSGQVLAELDPVPLRDSLIGAQAQLARAEAGLESDATSGTSGGSTSSGAAPSSSSRSRGSTGSSAQVTAALSAVAAAERTMRSQCAWLGVTAPASPTPAVPVGAAQQGAALQLPGAHSPDAGSDEPAPTPSGSSPSPTESPSDASSPSPSEPPSPSPTGSRSPSDAGSAPTVTDLQRCSQALLTLSAAEQRAAQALTAVSRASTGSTAATGSANTSGGNGSGAQGGGTTSSSARLIIDRAAVATAQRAVDLAEENLGAATLTAPMSGQVGAVDLVAGSQASASTGVTVVGQGAADVTISVPQTRLALVKVGQAATVAPQGGTGSLEGVVTRIGLLPVSTTTTTPSYPVVVRVPDAGTALADGVSAQVAVVIAHGASVPTLPVSALTGITNGRANALVLAADGSTSTVTVRTGAVGQGRVEVVSGLTLGQQVVLADLTAELPANSTQNLRRITGTGGGPGGAFPTGAPGAPGAPGAARP
jgi:multidrug efflux pump subunit AcrA (membrane-fusion protein)